MSQHTQASSVATVLSNRAKIAIAVAQKAAVTTAAVSQRPANSKTVQYATMPTKTAVKAANSNRQAQSVDQASATVTRRKPVPVTQAIVQRTLRHLTANRVVTAYNVPLVNAPVVISSARLSWAATRKATTHMLAIAKAAPSAARALSLGMGRALVYNRTSWTGQSAVVEGIVRMLVVPKPFGTFVRMLMSVAGTM